MSSDAFSHHRLPNRIWSGLKCTAVLGAFAFCSPLLMAQLIPDADLASPPANIELVEAGSLIIPMDNDLQNAGLSYFNIRSYGMIQRLLYADIPVKWAIRSGKGKDGVDFTAYAQRIMPTASAASNVSFRAGPFIVLSCFTNTIESMMRTYSTQQNVAVYRVMSNFFCDVRYTLRHKPRIAVLDDGGTESIHINAMIAAGIPTTNFIHLNAVGMLSLAETSCYTLAVAPHYSPSGSSESALHNAVTASVAAVRAFLNGGGNLFAQCAAVGTYENQSTQGLFQTTGGVTKNNQNTAPQYLNPDTPLNQFHGDINGSQGGSMTDYQLLSGSDLRSNTYVCIRNQTSPNLYIATGSKLIRNKRGSFIGYLGGHDYNAANNLAQINGRRVFLNSLFIPTLRPRDCELNFGSDLLVTKTVSTNVVYNGDLMSYTIVVSNLGPFTAVGAVITDFFPPEFTNVSWTMTATPGCFPTNASGNSDIVQMVDIPEHGAVTFVANGGVDATLCDPFDAACGVINEARANWETCYSDIEPSNNISRANITVFRSVISGQVRHDRDGDGDLTDPESGIPGVVIELYTDPDHDGNADDGELVETTVTDSLGRYSFVELLPGYYVMKQLEVNGFHATGDADGGTDSEISTPLPVGLYVLNMDFLLQAEYDLTISKRVNKEEDVDPGETLTYSITVLNAGTVNQTNVTIIDELPETMQYVPGSAWIVGFNGETTESAIDYFYSQSYTNSNGTIPWRTSWLEEGESDGPATGSIMVTQTVFALALSNNLVSVRDTHIRRGTPAGNFGTATEMLIRTNASTDDRVLIYFNLQTLSTNLVTEALLSIKPSKSGGASTRIFGITNEWTETGATWNNMANGYATNVYATFLPSSTSYTNINITSLAQEWINGGRTNRGLMIIQASGGNDIRIRPRERSGEEPRLIVKQDSGGLLDYALIFRGTAGQSVKRGLDLHGFTNGVFQFKYDFTTTDPTDFVSVEVSTNNIHWMTLTNIFGQVSGISTLALPYVYTTNAWFRFRNEGFGSDSAEKAVIDDVIISAERMAVLSTAGDAPPVLAEGFTLIPGGNLTVTFQATLMSAPDQVENTACVTSDDNPELYCDSVVSGLGIVLLTQGVMRVTEEIVLTKANELRWKGPDLGPVGESRYDLIFVDQTSKGFSTNIVDLWALIETVTNTTVFMDEGDIARIAPNDLSPNVMRFYRLAKPNKWKTNQAVRSASERVYAFKNVLLKPGENFVSLFAVPDRNEVSWVLGTNALPGGDSLEEATRIEWYGATSNGAATNQIWLSNSGNWLHSGGGLADHTPLPLHEGFNIILPTGSPTQNLQVIGRVPDEVSEANGHVVPVRGSNIYNIVSYNLPHFVRLGQSGLREAGFKGLSTGQPLNPLYSDELRILQRGGGSMAAPTVRILMNASGQFVYWTGGSRGASAENYTLQPDDALIIYTVKSTNNWTWTPSLPYPPPTREMSP